MMATTAPFPFVVRVFIEGHPHYSKHALESHSFLTRSDAERHLDAVNASTFYFGTIEEIGSPPTSRAVFDPEPIR